MGRPRRLWVKISISVVLTTLGLIVAAKYFLSSNYVADRIAAQLEQATGVPVRIGNANLGLTSSTLYDLKFLEPGADAGAPPLVTISALDTDLTLSQLLRGDFAGGTVTLRGPKLTVRLNGDNQPQSKIPLPELGDKPLPDIHIKAAQFRFQRDGNPEFLFTNVNGTLRKDGEKVVFEGGAVDPDLGKWTINGERPKQGQTIQFALHSDSVQAMPERLRLLPFVRPGTWDHVSIEGEMIVDATIQFGGPGAESPVHYQITVAPQKATVKVPLIAASGTETVGKATIQDGIVRLVNMHAQAYGGSFHVNAIINLSGETPNFEFVIEATRLLLHQAPKGWGLPAIDSRMSGKAHLMFTIENGKWKSSGKGEGAIESITSIPTPVTLLPDEDRGYRLKVGK